MNVENFKNSFDNVARSNIFAVSGFGLPADLSVRVKAASMPSENLGTIVVPFNARQVKVAGDRTYEPWVITVMGTNDYDVHRAFRAWNSDINSAVENVGTSPGGYKRDGIVDHLDVDGNIIETIQIVGAWPAIIGAVELDWENENQIATFEVTLEYDYHL